jgi:hypothetical protein
VITRREIFFGNTITCRNRIGFNQKPEQKLEYQAIARTRKKRDDGGDGLNDVRAH